MTPIIAEYDLPEAFIDALDPLNETTPTPRRHLPHPAHAAYSHCAFTGKALRFPRMMQGQVYTVIETLEPSIDT
jgi:hypothetical protein